jgi:nucleoside-diphosphate-sugar epimerase
MAHPSQDPVASDVATPRSPTAFSPPRRAFVIGGSGVVGRAISRRLLAAGWEVDVVGRDAANMPRDIATAARFHQFDRSDDAALRSAFGGGADLLVDCLCFTAADARTLLPLAHHATSTVMMSSKAVYVDAAGRHANSDDPPDYGGPIGETQATLAPGSLPHNSREGYPRNKVAAERTLLDSGRPVTVLCPSLIHGAGARPPREWVFVKRVLDRRDAVLLARRGRGIDHPCAAVNIAALVETVAYTPGQRILNIADPAAPDGLHIARTIARLLDHQWDEVLLDDTEADPTLGWHPWDRRHPVVLDTSAATKLGYAPVGDYTATVGDMVDWLVRLTGPTIHLPDSYDADYFTGRFNYQREDAFLATR